MKLAFWNNGAPRVLRSSKSVTLADGRVVFNVKPNPGLDLYAYRETGQDEGPFTRAAATTYENDGWTITATRTVAYIAVERIRELRIGQVNNEAGGRILAVLPDWKQRNLTARAVELTALGSANWNAGELAEWQAGQALWDWVKATRAATEAFAAAIEAETDPAAAAAIQPAWPDWPAGYEPEGA